MNRISIKFESIRRGWALALVLTAVPCLAQEAAQPEQPLVKAAKTKSDRKAKLVFTDDNLPRSPEPRGNEAPAAVEPAAASPADKAGEGTKTPNSIEPKPAAGSPQEARSRIESLKHDERVLIEKYDQIQRKLAETDDESLRRIYSDALSKRNERLELVRKQIEETERALSSAQPAGSAQGEK